MLRPKRRSKPQDGAELLDVSEQLGHHSASFRLDRYGHLMPRNRRRLVNRLDSLAPPTRWEPRSNKGP
jgi:hypothetical protein